MALATSLSLGSLQRPAFASVKTIIRAVSTSQTYFSKPTEVFPTQGKFCNFATIDQIVTAYFCLSRVRIHKEFEDGDSCTVYLKDRFKKQEEREELWYRQAFGDLRNMMNVHLQFTPMPDQIPPKKFIFLAQVHYTMYPEMVEEFGTDKYPGNPNVQTHIMTLEEPEDG